MKGRPEGENKISQCIDCSAKVFWTVFQNTAVANLSRSLSTAYTRFVDRDRRKTKSCDHPVRLNSSGLDGMVETPNNARGGTITKYTSGNTNPACHVGGRVPSKCSQEIVAIHAIGVLDRIL